MAISGVTCGRPSGRTVVSQYISACSSRSRALAHAIAVAPGLLNCGCNSATGSFSAIASLLSPDHRCRVAAPSVGSIVDRLVGGGPEVAAHIRRTGGPPGALGHQDRHHILVRVRIPGGAHPAVPAEPAGH